MAQLSVSHRYRRDFESGSCAVVGTLLVPVTFVIYVDGRVPVYDLPLSVLLICGLLGGVLGTVLASVWESDTIRDPWGTAHPADRADRGRGQADHPDRSADLHPAPVRPGGRPAGRVAVGTGFAVLETLGYGFVTLLTTRGDLSATETLLLVRGVSPRPDASPGPGRPPRPCGRPMPAGGGHGLRRRRWAPPSWPACGRGAAGPAHTGRAAGMGSWYGGRRGAHPPCVT